MRGQGANSEAILYGDFRSGQAILDKEDPIRDRTVNASNLELDLFGYFENSCGYSGTNTWIVKSSGLSGKWTEDVPATPQNSLSYGLIAYAIALETGSNDTSFPILSNEHQQQLHDQLQAAPRCHPGEIEPVLISWRGMDRVLVREDDQTFPAPVDKMAAIIQACRPDEYSWHRVQGDRNSNRAPLLVCVDEADEVIGLIRL